MTDFTRVLLTDKIAWELFGLAVRERLLYSSDAEEVTPTPKRGAVSQRALSYLKTEYSLEARRSERLR
jgi:hypothetical protein